jgi:hypothetical protein
MTATDVEDDGTRLEMAKRLAKERIETLYGGGLFASSAGETMIIGFSDRAEIYSRFTDSKPQLLNAIDRIQPTHGETNLDEALKLARAYTTNVNPDQESRVISQPATLELFSDGRIHDREDQVLRGEALIFNRIGTPDADNVAMTSISVDRPFDRPSTVEVFAALENMNPEPITCDVQLSVNDVTLGIQPVELMAAEVHPSTGELVSGRNTVVFTPFEQPRGAVIEVAILRDDDLAADNVAQLVVPPPKQLKVALVASGRSLIRSVMEGMSLEALDLLSTTRFERFAREGGLDDYDVIVLDDHAPEVLPDGRYLIFGRPPPIEGLNPYGDGTEQVVLDSRDEHPALRYVTLDYLFISKLKLLQPDDDIDVLAQGLRNVPLILESSRGPLQVIYVTFDPLDSNWPFKRSFVTFIVNAIDYLGHSGEGLASEGFLPGAAISTRLPPSAQDIVMRTPRGDVDQLSITDPTMFNWGPIREAGVYQLTWNVPGAEDEFERAFAVNLLSQREGEIAALEKINIGADTATSIEPGEGSYTPLWPWAVGICLGIMMLEWWVYHRKMML